MTYPPRNNKLEATKVVSLVEMSRILYQCLEVKLRQEDLPLWKRDSIWFEEIYQHPDLFGQDTIKKLQGLRRMFSH